MLESCYFHDVATLQVKNLPDDLHASLAARARALDMSMSEFVTRVLREELSRPTISEWSARVVAQSGDVRAIDIAWALDEARAEYDADERFTS